VAVVVVVKVAQLDEVAVAVVAVVFYLEQYRLLLAQVLQ
jgi:hypothetical protein